MDQSHGLRRRWILLAAVLLALAGAAGWGVKSGFRPERHDSDPPPVVPLRPPEVEPEEEPPPPPPSLVVVTSGLAGEPIPEVVVEAVLVPDGAEDHDAVPALASGTTDADGRATLSVPAGPCTVRVFHPVWFAAPVQTTVPSGDPLRIRLSPGVHLRVRVVDADGAPVPGAVLTDRWLGTMRGAITGPDGVGDLGAVHPENAFVWASKRGWLTNRAYFERLGMKGDEHTGELDLLRGGTLVVDAGLPGVEVLADTKGWSRLTGRTGEDGRVVLEGALVPPEISVTAQAPDGRSASVRIPVAAGETDRAVTLRFPAGRIIAGVVVRADDGLPVEGAEVFLGGTQPKATTGPDGRFEFGPVPGNAEDDIALIVVADGLAMAEQECGDVTPGPAGPRDLRVELHPTATLTGLVHDPAGEPLAGAFVSVRDNGGGSPLVVRDLDARTDADGRWRIAGVPPRESVTVLAMKDGAGVAWAGGVEAVSGGSSEVPEIRLPGVFTFAGRIVDEAGKPVARGWLWLRYRMKTEGMWAEWRVVRDGRIAPVHEIPRGGAVMEYQGPGFLKTVVLVKPETTEVVVGRACRAEGLAVLDADGSPLASDWLEFQSRDLLYTMPGNHASTTTDSRGAFEVTGLRKGRYVVRSLGTKRKAHVEIRRDGQDLGPVRFE